MAVSTETKLRWFDQGAAAFARTFPDRAAHLPDGAPYYVCPLCIRLDVREGTSKAFLFSRAAVSRGILTAEHVPPESFGGKELILTCAPCNHTAGAHLDSHARKRENPVDAFQGRFDEPVAVRLTADGHSIAAVFIKEGDCVPPTLLSSPCSDTATCFSRPWRWYDARSWTRKPITFQRFSACCRPTRRGQSGALSSFANPNGSNAGPFNSGGTWCSCRSKGTAACMSASPPRVLPERNRPASVALHSNGRTGRFSEWCDLRS